MLLPYFGWHNQHGFVEKFLAISNSFNETLVTNSTQHYEWNASSEILIRDGAERKTQNEPGSQAAEGNGGSFHSGCVISKDNIWVYCVVARF